MQRLERGRGPHIRETTGGKKKKKKKPLNVRRRPRGGEEVSDRGGPDGPGPGCVGSAWRPPYIHVNAKETVRRGETGCLGSQP